MGAGSGALGFGGGFAKGFANGILRKHQEDRETKQRSDDARAREAQTLLPLHVQMAIDSGDYGGLEQFVTANFPEAAKAWKKEGNPLEHIAPLLRGQSHAAAAPAGVQPAAAPAATPDQTAPQGEQASALTQSGQPPVLPSRTLVDPQTPPKPGPTFFGTPVLTPDQRAERDANATVTQRRVLAKAATALHRADPEAFPTIQAALMSLGVATPLDRQGTLPQTGTFGDYLLRLQSDRGKPLTAPEVEAARTQWEKLNNPIPFYGSDREALSKDLFDKPYNDLDKGQRDIVLREEQLLLSSKSQSRTEGVGQGKMNTPADLNTAQDTGVAVGTKAADVAGQAVPTTANRDARRNVENLKTSLEDIKSRLLVALPKKGDLGAMAPGAAYALRRRLPAYRDQIAALESAVNGIVNVVARSVGEQRGAQTEKDAIRAEAGIVSLRDALLAGDTQESASARIDETLTIVGRILNSMPDTPVKPPKPEAAPAAAPTTAPSTGFTVIYEGKPRTFPTQAKLDAFKRAVGIN